MATLREQFMADLKEAMKAGDRPRLSTIRLIQSAVKDKDIEGRPAGKEQASDEEVLALLQKMIKQRQESISIYDANGRPELADAERAEVAVIQSYLPQQMDEDEMLAAIRAAIAATGASSVKDMGKVIGALKSGYAGQMDFGRASALVKTELAG